MKPVIGLSPSFDIHRDALYLRHNYSHMINHCGGTPIVLSHSYSPEDISRQLDLIDGLVITGGADISPALYGEEQLCKGEEIQTIRDDFDKELFSQALKRDMPLFGICRGFQFMNISLGGTLYQDTSHCLHTSLLHRLPGHEVSSCHKVNILPQTPLHQIIGKDSIPVNSIHHQCIHELAESLAPMALSPDNIIEAYYHPETYCLWGVQWHPEFIYTFDENSCKILRAFIERCK